MRLVPMLSMLSRCVASAPALRGGVGLIAAARPRGFVTMQQKTVETMQAVKAAAAVVEEVSGSVSGSRLEAPDVQGSFVAMDSARSGLVDENGLPLVYDKAAIQKYWDTQGGALQQRWIEFLAQSVPWLTKVATMLLRGGAEELDRNAEELARDARISIEELGPTFVKLGQMLSVRPDVLPKAALRELEVLQARTARIGVGIAPLIRARRRCPRPMCHCGDRPCCSSQDGVEGFDTSIAHRVIEAELGPISEIFDEIDEEPAAAASLAQVYRAKLKSTGEWVAVKVQRPGVQASVSKDLYVLRRAAEVYQGLVRRFAPQQRTDVVALLNEWAIGFYTELDFKNEASNMQRMADVLAENNVEGVVVPRVYSDLTTRKVLVSEWIDGKKLSECEPHQVRELIGVAQECFLVQLLKAGFFHSDPHPGNLLRPHDQSKAKLVLIDFGLVAQVSLGPRNESPNPEIHQSRLPASRSAPRRILTSDATLLRSARPRWTRWSPRSSTSPTRTTPRSSMISSISRSCRTTATARRHAAATAAITTATNSSLTACAASR